MLTLSKDQKEAIKKLIDWFDARDKSQFITLGGYAGTGKTTLISHLRRELSKKKKKKKVSFVSYTGKASQVLKKILEESKSLTKKDFVGTIHSLIYSPIENDNGEIIGWEKKDKIQSDLIIIDEASMVNEGIWNDLLSFNVPIIAVGDHGQLPPIKGRFNLMQKPHLRLEEIHRQAKDNPIIQLSILARKFGNIPPGYHSKKVQKFSKKDPDSRNEVNELLSEYKSNTMVLCGYNTTRVKLNTFIRKSLEFDSPMPQRNDRVICLRNNHTKQIFNGMLGTIHTIESKNEDWFNVEVDFDDGSFYKGQISQKQFNRKSPLNFTKERSTIMNGDLFDFGYALTVHKAQGSQSPRVILFEERFRQMDDEMWKRWLYTAVTRAEEELFIIGE